MTFRAWMADFQTTFETLKKYTGDNPERLWLATEDPRLKDAAVKLNRLVGQLESGMPQLPQTYIEQVPRGFQETLRDYQSRYKQPVRKIADDVSDKFISEFFNFTPEKAPAMEKGGRREWEPVEFDPNIDNAGDCLDELFEYLENRTIFLEENGLPDKPEWENLVNVALGAWEYLRTQGINTIDVAERLKKVPFILIPKDVSDRHSRSAKLSLFSLLQNAVQAYVCGAPLAAAAMCRATGELVLKRNYGLEFKRKYPQLKEIVSEAVKKFPHLKQLELYTSYDRVNEIMHTADRISGISVADEEFILGLFRKTRTVIEEAPVLR